MEEIKQLLRHIRQILIKLENQKLPAFYPGEWICNKDGEFVDKVKRIDNPEIIRTVGGFGWDVRNIRRATEEEIDDEMVRRIKNKISEEQMDWLEKRLKIAKRVIAQRNNRYYAQQSDS